MSSLIVYCSLMSIVVYARLASTTIPVSKDCVLEMKENEISQIVELFDSNLVHVVEIRISFSGGSHYTDYRQLVTDFQVSLSNRIGREILYALEIWYLRFVTFTLKAGIRNLKLNVKGSQKDCIKTVKGASTFSLETAQHIVDSINLTTNYQVCFSYKETLYRKVITDCCDIMKPNLATKLNYNCIQGTSFIFGSGLPWSVIGAFMVLFSFFYVLWLLLVLLGRTEFDLKYPKFYKLEESIMSPSSILCKVFWDENGRLVSFIRSLVLVGVFSYFCYLVYWATQHFIVFILAILFTIWAISFLGLNIFASRITKSSKILDRIKEVRNNVFQKHYNFHFNPEPSSEKSKRRDFEIIVEIILLPFNAKVWGSVIKMLYKKCKDLAGDVTGWFNNRILKTLALGTYLVLAVLICFVFSCLFFCVLIVLTTSYPILILWNFIVLVCTLDYSGFFIRARPFLPVALGFFLFVFLSVLIIIFSIASFLLGLFLNLIYFIPYFAFLSVLTFYCCRYWQTMEEQYFVLKRLIYEACQETLNANNGCIPNKHPEPNEEVIPVVSKELYDKIREELLPYDTNLLYFVLKMVWSIAFSLGIFALINMLNESNVTDLVRVVTTASLGVMPHVFNMIGLKTGEERKKAWNEKLKLNVKYKIKELIAKDFKLARTVLIVKQDDYMIPDDPSLARWLKRLLGCHITWENEVENDPTTDDVNTEYSEHVETMFGICFELPPTVNVCRNDNEDDGDGDGDGDDGDGDDDDDDDDGGDDDGDGDDDDGDGDDDDGDDGDDGDDDDGDGDDDDGDDGDGDDDDGDDGDGDDDGGDKAQQLIIQENDDETAEQNGLCTLS